MKNALCLLAVFALTAPAFAADPNVYLTCEEGDDPCSVVVHYRSDQAGDVSGFAFDIEASGGAVITAVVPEFQGISDGSENKGYGIFLGYLKENMPNPPGEPYNDWGTPEAPGGQPGTAGSIPGPAVTVELATLHDPDEPTHMPAQTGILLTVYTDKPCELAFTANTTRAPASPGEVGGAVLANESLANLVQLGTCEVVAKQCYILGMARHVWAPAQTVQTLNYNAWLNIPLQYQDIWCSDNQPAGDANNDGYANPQDYIAVFNNAGKSAAQSPYTDVNHDGYTNPQDYIQIFNYAGKGTGVPCPIAFP